MIGILLGDSPCFGACFLWTLFVISSIYILLRQITIKWLLLISAICLGVFAIICGTMIPIVLSNFIVRKNKVLNMLLIGG